MEDLEMKPWLIVVVVIVVIAVGVGGFFGGRATAGGGTPTLQAALTRLQNATPAERQQAFSSGGGLGGIFGRGGAAGGTGGTGRTGGGAVAGSIISADSTSITVKSADGSTKIVLVSGSTTIARTQPGTVADLTTGQTVIVTGTRNSDGTVTATRVQVGVTLPNRTGTPGQGATTGTSGAASGTPGATTAPSQ
jgi:hypothetical protein